MNITGLYSSLSAPDRSGMTFMQIIDVDAGKVVTSWPCSVKNVDRGIREARDLLAWIRSIVAYGRD
jgi:hypothetical protein